MIEGYVSESGRLRRADIDSASVGRIVWIDLLNPSDAERDVIQRLLGVEVPTREDMEEIEISSRLYNENGAAYMTATLPANADGDDPLMQPVTFLLADGRLITVRHHEPKVFKTFPARAEKVAIGATTGEGILIALLEAIVDRLADILERAGREIDAISREVFQHGRKPTQSQDLQRILQAIGRKGDLTSDIRDSLITLDRLTGFLGQGALHRKSEKEIRERIKTLSRDVRSLADHVSFAAQKITFLLDATLGLINIEQNSIIKIFSVAAVAFLPPTLIASIYGMNFQHMPELDEKLGYPIALGLMILSAILPFFYFKRRGWL